MEISKKDWQLFREKLPVWQERYMEKLIAEYAELLKGNELASDKFWELDKRIRNDKKSYGVHAQYRKSDAFHIILSLVYDNAITLDDLSEFSEDLRSIIERYTYYDNQKTN